MSDIATRSMLDAPPPESRARSLAAGAGAVVVHAAFVASAAFLGTRVVRHAAVTETVTQMIEVELPKAEPEPIADVPQPKLPRLVRAPKPTAETPAAAPAPAPAVLAAHDQVVDFGDAIVMGNGDRYAGGVTAATGTATSAVRDVRARAGGVGASNGTSPPKDLSRPPRLAGGAEWDCPFPPEADQLGIERAVVMLRIEVGADGRVRSVRATSDPGNGFAQEARRCAMDKPWEPGLDGAGNPIPATAVVSVNFER